MWSDSDDLHRYDQGPLGGECEECRLPIEPVECTDLEGEQMVVQCDCNRCDRCGGLVNGGYASGECSECSRAPSEEEEEEEEEQGTKTSVPRSRISIMAPKRRARRSARKGKKRRSKRKARKVKKATKKKSRRRRKKKDAPVRGSDLLK